MSIRNEHFRIPQDAKPSSVITIGDTVFNVIQKKQKERFSRRQNSNRVSLFIHSPVWRAGRRGRGLHRAGGVSAALRRVGGADGGGPPGCHPLPGTGFTV